MARRQVKILMARYPGTVVGLKDSGCQRETSLVFARALMPPLQVWVGNEPDLQTLAGCGSRGAVSGVANLLPRLVQRLVAGPGQPGSSLQRVLDLCGQINAEREVPRLLELIAREGGTYRRLAELQFTGKQSVS